MDANDRAAAAAILRDSVWLEGERQALSRPILEHARVVRLGAGQWAHAEGDEEAGVLLVLSGAMQMFCKAPGDREVLIGQIGPGAALGQTARFGGGPRLLTAIAREDSRLLMVSDRALGRIALSAPEIWESVAALLYRQTRDLMNAYVEAVSLPPRQRLAARLVRLNRGPDLGVVPLTQQALGEMVGLSRKTVHAHLSAFEREGLIQRAYGEVRVLDASRLWAVAEA